MTPSTTCPHDTRSRDRSSGGSPYRLSPSGELLEFISAADRYLLPSTPPSFYESDSYNDDDGKHDNINEKKDFRDQHQKKFADSSFFNSIDPTRPIASSSSSSTSTHTLKTYPNIKQHNVGGVDGIGLIPRPSALPRRKTKNTIMIETSPSIIVTNLMDRNHDRQHHYHHHLIHHHNDRFNRNVNDNFSEIPNVPGTNSKTLRLDDDDFHRGVQVKTKERRIISSQAWQQVSLSSRA